MTNRYGNEKQTKLIQERRLLRNLKSRVLMEQQDIFRLQYYTTLEQSVLYCDCLIKDNTQNFGWMDFRILDLFTYQNILPGEK